MKNNKNHCIDFVGKGIICTQRAHNMFHLLYFRHVISTNTLKANKNRLFTNTLKIDLSAKVFVVRIIYRYVHVYAHTNNVCTKLIHLYCGRLCVRARSEAIKRNRSKIIIYRKSHTPLLPALYSNESLRWAEQACNHTRI